MDNAPRHLRGLADDDTSPVSIRLTASERRMLEFAAKKYRVPLGTFIRSAAISIARGFHNNPPQLDAALRTESNSYAYGAQRRGKGRVRIDAWGDQVREQKGDPK